jgi:ankyrin repeat protein
VSWAARGGKDVVVRLLLEKEADQEPKSEDGQTPLSFTIGNEHEGSSAAAD